MDRKRLGLQAVTALIPLLLACGGSDQAFPEPVGDEGAGQEDTASAQPRADREGDASNEEGPGMDGRSIPVLDEEVRRKKGPSSEDRCELESLIRRLEDATTEALRRDRKDRHHDDKDEFAKRVLRNRPLEPEDRDKFVPAIYPDTPPLVPAEGPPPTTEEVAELLRDYLARDWPHDRDIQRVGMRLFEHPAVIAKVPNPSLRAALVALGRTIGVDAIRFTLLEETPEGLPLVIRVEFNGDILSPEGNTIAVSLSDNATGQLLIVFNPRYEAENPFLFTPFMAHEPLHNDPLQGGFEEAVLAALDRIIALQQIARHPELTEPETELTRRSNSNTLARLNAGEGYRLGNFTNDGRLLFPGSPTIDFTSYFDQFEGANLVPTPGSDLLAEVLERLQGKREPECSPEEYNRDLFDCVIESQDGLKPRHLLIAVKALELELDTCH
jgi:hypothetical protein